MSPSFGFLYTTLLATLLYITYAAEYVPCRAYHSDFYDIVFDNITNETYETLQGTESYQIGWKRMIFCQEGHNKPASRLQYTSDDGLSDYLELVSKYAITVKIVPDDDTDPDFDNKAIYGKICQNPIVALNNNKELSYTIDVDTITTAGALNPDDWYDRSDGSAIAKLVHGECSHDLYNITTDVIHSCQTRKGLHIEPHDHKNPNKYLCEWDSAQVNAGKFISIYFGFDANKKHICGGRGTGDLQTITSLPKQRRRRAQRRRLQTTNYYDEISGDLYNAPCLRLQVGLETENVVPTNNDPDPQSNIMLIGMGLAGDTTNGILTFADIPDPTLSEDPVLTDENTWDVECVDETEVEEQYIPSGDPLNPDEGELIPTNNGFQLIIDFTTPDSILYSFDLNTLDLTLSHTCTQPIALSAVLNDDDGDILGETVTISISPNMASTKYAMSFIPLTQYLNGSSYTYNEMLRLYPNLDFRIIFTATYADADACDLTQVTIGDTAGQRRRMYVALSDIQAVANPNACMFLGNLVQPQSHNLLLAQQTMCQSDWELNQPVINGLWRMKNQQVAIGDHLVRPGSLRVFDNTGTQIYIDKTWPLTPTGAKLKKPCFAVDEDTRRVFAIGGFTGSLPDGTPSDTITVYQLGEDMMSGSVVSELEGWKLDKPRWAAMCWYWRKDENTEYLVVVSGVTESTDDEFDADAILGDVRLFPIPTSSFVINNIWLGQTFSLPETGTKYLKNKQVLDSRVALYDGRTLYFWGGKTSTSSTNVVSRVDLLDIETSGTVTAATVELMRLTKDRALPMIDKVPVDMGDIEGVKECFAVFMGQAWAPDPVTGLAVYQEIDDNGDPGLNRDNLQLFCNDNINPEADIGRRRLAANIASFTEYDREMFAKGRRRRLQGEQEESEVFIRDYNYELDGVWYDMDVEVEVCYESNIELQDAVRFYSDLIGEIANDGANWSEYKEDIEEKILNKSIETYSYWSNGFGAVNLLNLAINNINAFECKPVVQIYVNEGCDAQNIELWDTDIEWNQEVAIYDNVYDVVSEVTLLSDEPLDTLSQAIMGHACDTDNDLSAARDDMHIYDYYYDDDNNPAIYPWHYYVIAVIAIYNVFISYCLWCNNSDKCLMCCCYYCKKKKNNPDKIIYDSDSVFGNMI